MSVRLHDVAHARAGDKGDTSTLTVIPYVDEDYAWLVRELTAERVQLHLRAQVRGPVTRFELPNIAVLQFVCRQSLDGGVTTSLAVDAHGKTLSSLLLGLDLPDRTPGSGGRRGR